MKWTNWSGSVQANPELVSYPKTEEAISKLVQQAAESKKRIRVVGSGHSFTPLVASNQIFISLDKLQGVIEIDAEKKEAEIWAGTKIKALSKVLFEAGLAQENLGDVDVQSIAGATATGTHGTGINFGNISTQIISMSFIDGQGNLVSCSESDKPDVFNAARISLGALGIITRVRLRLQSSYRVEYTERREDFDTCLSKVDDYIHQNRNFEFYWFPYSEHCQLKFMNETEKPAKINGFARFMNDFFVENVAFWTLCKIVYFFPKTRFKMGPLIGSFVSPRKNIHYSHLLYATIRLVKFQEMEYNVPLEVFPEVAQEIKKRITDKKHNTHFPTENRFVKGDDIWLSPAYKRKSAYIAVHVFKGMEYLRYFKDMEDIFKDYGGRPHWGKMHFRRAEELAELYPKWSDFMKVRERFDPQKIFLNDYLLELFGLQSEASA